MMAMAPHNTTAWKLLIMYNKPVFKADTSDAVQMSRGKMFHVAGPATEHLAVK